MVNCYSDMTQAHCQRTLSVQEALSHCEANGTNMDLPVRLMLSLLRDDVIGINPPP